MVEMAMDMPDEAPLGNLKRMEVARALALDPKILILDKPLAGLNQREAEKLADTISELIQQGQSMILIEHNLREVMRICSRLVVLDNGRLLAEGSPKSVLSQSHVQEAYLGKELHVNP